MPAETMVSSYCLPQLDHRHASWDSQPQSSSDRQTRAQRPTVYRTTPENFDINKFATFKNLCTVYEYVNSTGGQAAGIDGFRFRDISKPVRNRIIKQLREELVAGTYIPDPALPQPVPKNGYGNGTRLLEIPTIFDRVVMKALELCLHDYWKSVLPGFERDVWTLFALMRQAIRRDETYIAAIDDIRNCYPSVLLDEVIRSLQQYHQNQALMCLTQQIIRGHRGPDHQTGLDQGSPCSPVFMELFLHERLDEMIRMSHPGITQLRYVDNITYLCSSVPEGTEALLRTEDILGGLQMQLKHQDGPPTDLRDPSHGKSILGLIPVWRNGDLHFTIPEESFQALDMKLTIRNQTPKPLDSIRATLFGWINAMGPALSNTIAPGIIDRVTEIATGKGIREFPTSELLSTARSARKRWLNLSQRYD